MIAEKIGMEQIESSNLDAIGYNPEKQILAVRFRSGAVYHHAPFTPEQLTSFYASESKGRHYNLAIKGKVAGQKMTGKCTACGNGPGWIGETCDSCGTAVYADTPKASER